jgi:hypothetical protein
VQGAIAAPAGGLAFRLDAAKYFNGEPPDDDALLAGLARRGQGRCRGSPALSRRLQSPARFEVHPVWKKQPPDRGA